MTLSTNREHPLDHPTLNTARRTQRVRHELKRREVVVARVERISPHFQRVVFTGDALADFVSLSFDDHLKLILDGGAAGPVMRDYTPRRFDAKARELDIEFALHGDGPAANWARQVVPGQRATLGGPRGSFIVPTDCAWHLLVGDSSALPAVARRLEELPSSTRAIVRMVVADPSDRRALASAAPLDVAWFASFDELLASMRQQALPVGEGYAWCAGEAGAMAAVRRLLIDDKQHDRHAIRAAAYWKLGRAAHHENLED